MGYLGKNRYRVWHGAECAKQSQYGLAERATGGVQNKANLGPGALGLRISECGLKTRTAVAVMPSCGVRNKANPGEGVSSLKCEVSNSTPARRGDPSRGRLGHMVADSTCRTKPISQAGSCASRVYPMSGGGWRLLQVVQDAGGYGLGQAGLKGVVLEAAGVQGVGEVARFDEDGGTACQHEDFVVGFADAAGV